MTTEEQIEFGEALHAALSHGLIPIHQGQKIYRVRFNIGSTNQYSLDLIEWYRNVLKEVI